MMVTLKERPQSAFVRVATFADLVASPEDAVFWPDEPQGGLSYLRDVGGGPCIYKLVNARYVPGRFLAMADDANADQALPDGLVGQGRGLLITGGGEVFAESFTSGRKVHKALCVAAGEWRVNMAGPPPQERATGVFVEFITAHFGHVLTDMIGRFWPFDDPEMRRVLGSIRPFAIPLRPGSDRGVKDWPVWTREVLGALGVAADQIALMNRITTFRELYVPSRVAPFLSSSGRRYDQMMVRVGDRISAGRPEGAARRLFLSRSRLADNQRALGQQTEARVDDIFASRGFEVFHPQEHAPDVQVGTVRGAEMVAGLAGSQLHLAVFSRRRVRMLRIGPDYFPGVVDAKILAEKSGVLSQVFVRRDCPPDVSPHKAPWTFDAAELAMLETEVDRWIGSEGPITGHLSQRVAA
jgi:hypothetical protein